MALGFFHCADEKKTSENKKWWGKLFSLSSTMVLRYSEVNRRPMGFPFPLVKRMANTVWLKNPMCRLTSWDLGGSLLLHESRPHLSSVTVACKDVWIAVFAASVWTWSSYAFSTMKYLFPRFYGSCNHGCTTAEWQLNRRRSNRQLEQCCVLSALCPDLRSNSLAAALHSPAANRSFHSKANAPTSEHGNLVESRFFLPRKTSVTEFFSAWAQVHGDGSHGLHSAI